jgi:hypothetical protein
MVVEIEASYLSFGTYVQTYVFNFLDLQFWFSNIVMCIFNEV